MNEKRRRSSSPAESTLGHREAGSRSEMKLEPGRMIWTSRNQAANIGCGRYCSLAYKRYSYNYKGKRRPPTYPLLVSIGNYPAKVSKVVIAENYHQ